MSEAKIERGKSASSNPVDPAQSKKEGEEEKQAAPPLSQQQDTLNPAAQVSSSGATMNIDDQAGAGSQPKSEPKIRISNSNSHTLSTGDDRSSPKIQISGAVGESTFLTNVMPYKGIENFPKIGQYYSQLNDLIQNLETKVDTVLERHESEFLIAYRNHMNKIQKELADMKRRHDEQEKNLSANDRVAGLEKQLGWFREECLKLYNKLEQKSKENDELRMKNHDLDKDKQFLENQVKALMKQNQYLEIKLMQQQQASTAAANIFDQEMSFQLHQRGGASGDHSGYSNVRPISGGKQQQQQQQQPLGSGVGVQSSNSANRNFQTESPEFDEQELAQLDNITPYASVIGNLVKKLNPDPMALVKELVFLVKNIEEKKDQSLKGVKEKLEKTVQDKLRMNVVRSDLENFFLECVETVRRQIIRRKYLQKDPSNLNYYLNQVKDYNIFRMEDQIKILQLLVSHEQILIYIYQKIFPNQFNMYLQGAYENENKQPGGAGSSNGGGGTFPNISEQNNLENTMDHSNNELLQLMEEIDEENNQIPRSRNQNMSFDAGPNNARTQYGANSIQRKDLNSSFQSGHPRTADTQTQISDKVMIQKGKLVFQPM